VIDAFLRLVLAIVLDTIAFVIWDVSTPFRLLVELFTGTHKQRALLFGFLRFIAGFALFILSEIVIIPLAIRVGSTTILEFGALATAFLAEQLAGPALRGRPRARRES